MKTEIWREGMLAAMQLNVSCGPREWQWICLCWVAWVAQAMLFT